MKESSIVWQHLAYKDIHQGGGVVEVEVTHELQKCVKGSYRIHKAAHEEATQKESKLKKERAEKRHTTFKLDDAVVKKKALLSEMKCNKLQIDAETNELNKQLRKWVWEVSKFLTLCSTSYKQVHSFVFCSTECDIFYITVSSYRYSDCNLSYSVFFLFIRK